MNTQSTQNEVIGRNIAHFRVRLDLSQEQLAEYLGVQRPMISYFETGARVVPTKFISKLANLFGIEEIDLYEDDASQISLQLAFAFRAGDLLTSDLDQVASFKKIALNYLHLKKLAYDASGNS